MEPGREMPCYRTKYYEKADLAGAVLTPQTWAEYIKDPTAKTNWGEVTFTEYDVPWKCQCEFKTGVLAWVTHFLSKNDYDHYIGQTDLKGPKLLNTHAFIDHFLAIKADALRKWNKEHKDAPLISPDSTEVA